MAKYYRKTSSKALERQALAHKLSRRRILQAMGAGMGLPLLAGLTELFPEPTAYAQGIPGGNVKGNNYFVLYVEFGSCHAGNGGLFQPLPSGQWPIGMFKQNMQAGSTNPGVNDFYAVTKGVTLNGYTKFLAPIVNHMTWAAVNAETLDHTAGSLIASSGLGNTGDSCSWTTGFAQLFYDPMQPSAIVNATNARLNTATTKVQLIGGDSLAAFTANFQDVPGVGSSKYHDPIWAVLSKQYAKRFGPAALDDQAVLSAQSGLQNIIYGNPALSTNNPVVQTVMSSITTDAANALLATIDDADNTKLTNDSVIPKLQLAAIGAATGILKGASFSFGGADTHLGGSALLHPRDGAQLMAQLMVFWQCIMKLGLQDKVLVVVSSHFTRTPDDPTNPGNTGPVNYKGQTVQTQAFGNNHHPIRPIVCINSKLSGLTKIGAVADYNVVTGTSATDGTPDLSIPAYTSLEVLGTLALRCFPELLPRGDRDVRMIYPGFVSNSQLMNLVLG